MAAIAGIGMKTQLQKLATVGNLRLPTQTQLERILHVTTNPHNVSFASPAAGSPSHGMGQPLNKAADMALKTDDDRAGAVLPSVGFKPECSGRFERGRPGG